MSLIQAEALSKRFLLKKGYTQAFLDLSFSILPRETLGLIGESGSGKSALGKCLLRLEEPTSGGVYFENQDLLKFSKKQLFGFRRKAQIILQDPYASLNPKMTAAEAIMEPLQIHCKHTKEVNREVEAVDEPCTSGVNHDIVSEIEEDALCDAEEALHAKQQNKMQDQAEDLKQKSIAEEDRVFGDVEKNKRIKLINKDYEANTDIKKAEAGKLDAIGMPGQAAYYVAQGLSEHQKAKSQKESLVQQVQQDNQNQQGNTSDGVKKDIDKLSDFDPFRRNSASLSQR